jgi:hypothetical protein
MFNSNTPHFLWADVVFVCPYSTVIFRRLFIFTYESNDGILVQKSCLLVMMNNRGSDWLEVASHVLNKSNEMSHQPNVFLEEGGNKCARREASFML